MSQREAFEPEEFALCRRCKWRRMCAGLQGHQGWLPCEQRKRDGKCQLYERRPGVIRKLYFRITQKRGAL